jgi:membrane peptidoglycan carboxypeptidase
LSISSGSASARGRRFGKATGLLLILSIAAGVCVAGLAAPLVGLVGGVTKTSADTFNNLPTQLLIPPLPTSSKILDSRGHVLATLHGTEDRTAVTLDQVPDFMQQALIDIEDSRFYKHHGVDYKGIARAAVHNQQAGDVQQGGSTLTQQYVKNVLIESAKTKAELDKAREDTLSRKLKEARLALALEKQKSKQWILIHYLNIAYFGDGAYGIGAAAQHYFGVPISKINIVQAAMLAGLVRSPDAYDPLQHPKTALQRRNTVLARMHDLGHISTKVYKYALTFPLLLHPDKTVNTADSCQNAYAPFYCRYVVDQLLNDKRFGLTRTERERTLFSGGLTIKTTLDPDVQAAAQNAVNAVVPPGNRVAAATDVIQPGTGNLLAMAVNRAYGDPPAGKDDNIHSKFPYPTSTVKGGYQAGSTFKMFTLATALSQGLPLSTTYYSPQCIKIDGFSNIVNNCPVSFFSPDGSGFKNAGDSEAGTFNMVNGTWDSVNTYYLQLEAKVGVLNVVDMARKLGVTSKRLNDVGPVDGSFTLGAFESSVLDVATAYATIAAHGKRCYARPILGITSINGKVPFTAPQACKQVLDPQIADTVTGILEGVITSGTAAANGGIGRTAAGKTGTTDNFAGAEFVGFVPQMAAAVWVGDSKYPQQRYLSAEEGFPVDVPGWNPGSPVYGGDLPTMIWSRLMQSALANQPVEPMPAQIFPPAPEKPLNPTPAPPPPPPPPPTTTAPKPQTKPTKPATKPTKPATKPTKPTTHVTPGTAGTPAR